MSAAAEGGTKVAKLAAGWNDGYANISADRIDEREGMVYAYDVTNKLVGIFDLGIINYIYITGGTNEGKA